jgi:hypothetical protein
MGRSPLAEWQKGARRIGPGWRGASTYECCAIWKYTVPRIVVVVKVERDTDGVEASAQTGTGRAYTPRACNAEYVRGMKMSGECLTTGGRCGVAER